MADFPQSHTTTTTTTHTATVTSGRVHLDIAYIKTIPGILRIVEIALCLILFICSVSACNAVPWNTGSCGWAGFVGFMGFVLVIAWLLFYLFHVHDALPNAPWLLIEMIWYAVWTAFLIISGIALAVLANEYRPANCSGSWAGNWCSQIRGGAGAGAFFAFVAAIVFGAQTFFLFREWRSRSTVRGPIAGHP